MYKYVGRMDNTVKRWGHRVYMEQIEMLAAECTEVAAACCVMHADSLGLFVVLHENSPPIQVVREKLKRFLVQKLNKASMPDIIFQQDLLPITRHGEYFRDMSIKSNVSQTRPLWLSKLSQLIRLSFVI